MGQVVVEAQAVRAQIIDAGIVSCHGQSPAGHR